MGVSRNRLVAAVAGLLVLGLVVPPALATELNQQEFNSTGACVEWVNEIDEDSSEVWDVCAEVYYESRLFGAVEKTTANAWASHAFCEEVGFGVFCSGEGSGGEIDPAGVTLDAGNNVTGVHTTLAACDIEMAIDGTGEGAATDEYYKAPVDTDLVTLQRYHDTYSTEGAIGTGTACGWPVVAERASDRGYRGQARHEGLAVQVHDGQ